MCVSRLGALALRSSAGVVRGFPFRAAAFEEGLQEHEADAHGDRRVGDVEGGPVVAAPVDVEEVDHVAEAQAVDDVTDGAGEDQGEGEAQEPLVRP